MGCVTSPPQKKTAVAEETRDEIDGLNNDRASDNEPIRKSKAQKREYLSRLDCGEIRKVAWVFSGFFVLTSTLTEERKVEDLNIYCNFIKGNVKVISLEFSLSYKLLKS